LAEAGSKLVVIDFFATWLELIFKNKKNFLGVVLVD